MNVLFVSHSANLSGAPLSCFHLMSRLGSGFKPVFVSPTAGPLTSRIEDAGIPHFKISQKGFLGLQFISAFKRLIKRERIDVVHLNTLTPFSKYAGIAAKLCGVPSVWFVRENPLISRSRRLKRWARVLAQRIVFVDNMTRRQMFPGVEPEYITTIYNGADLSLFHPEPSSYLQDRFGMKDNGLAMGYIGMITERKGVEHLIRAFEIIQAQEPRTRLFIIGGHDERDEDHYRAIRGLVTELGLEDVVHFTGPLEDVRPALASLDMVVLPSLEERCSRTLIEALACAMPCVATAVGGTPEIVVDGSNGILVPPADPGTLAKASLRLLTSPELRAEMGRAGRARAEQLFDIKSNVRQVESLYQEVAGR